MRLLNLATSISTKIVHLNNLSIYLDSESAGGGKRHVQIEHEDKIFRHQTALCQAENKINPRLMQAVGNKTQCLLRIKIRKESTLSEVYLGSCNLLYTVKYKCSIVTQKRSVLT